MSVIDRTNVLSGIKVSEAMRRLVVSLSRSASVEQAARFTIKFKVNAILVLEDDATPVGVVSKTDLMGAYYAGMTPETAVEAIMVAPPVFCGECDSLETALDRMKTHGIHRLYVLGESPEQVVGVLAYPDIVGMLYRFCHKCDRSLVRSRKATERLGDHYRVVEIMSPSAHSVSEAESLGDVMESLSAHRFGAILVRDQQGLPAGVVSKSDLMVAYRHGVSTEVPAGEIMTRPVHACNQEDSLASAIQHMIYSDVHRMFVFKGDEQNIVGTLSLSDAARARSGSCRACLSSRIRVEETVS
jgi:CBS domain-containing protein